MTTPSNVYREAREMICTLDGCAKPHIAKGYCWAHYARFKKYGDPLAVAAPRKRKTPAERMDDLFARVELQGDCRQWTGAIGGAKSPYGRFNINGRMERTHRLVYEHMVGPIPTGLELDHLCRNTRCCNPDHLEPVPTRINVLRSGGVTAVNARKTHCPQGHPYSGDNLIATSRGGRRCRECTRESQARMYENRRSRAAR